ncbi:hypothetical protein [Candidatus Puniceispirillum marinum]|uniref:PpiC-type peptidyl-prolyl cis-trans isomerase n=1 Tax=Puniceispirillum marinum (strain IMCC1322) TaxID=488538 RepID=D5BTU3_PUNMI|nr:hypothetical protein [Candidatus Puniceispirillum marinum]ADE39690.1 PpiC-type peptidyl-prolyl cis-trans isomerase [Candidatus Puniceispirillum marinum IMCC1322]
MASMLTPLENEDSYSLATKARIEDILDKFIEDLEDLGNDDAVEKILNAEKIVVDKKNRRVSDFVEVIYDELTKGISVRVVIKRDDLIDPITVIIKESGFNRVARVGRTNMMDVKLPKPTFEQLEALSEKVDQLRTTAINKATAIKADSLQRIKAGMDKEYLEAPEAKKATEQIELVLREVAMHIRVIARIKQKKMLKTQFVWEDKEQQMLLEPLMKKAIYRGIVK